MQAVLAPTPAPPAAPGGAPCPGRARCWRAVPRSCTPSPALAASIRSPFAGAALKAGRGTRVVPPARDGCGAGRAGLQVRAAGFGGFGAQRKKEQAEPCPCGGGEDKLPYKECCEQLHTYKKKPQNALELMKSRYSAYAKGKVDWVVTTTHPEHPSAAGSKLPDGRVVTTLVQDVKATCKKVEFLGLEILDHRAGDTPDEEFVRFKIRIQMKGQKGGNKGKVEEITEESFFTREEEDGKWMYRAGAPEGSEEEKNEARKLADEMATKMGAKPK